MKSLLIAFFACTALLQSLSAQEADPDARVKARAVATAKILCHNYFIEHYEISNANLESTITLGEPTPVDGWTGRWRMQGQALLRNYRSGQAVEAKKEELRANTKLSEKRIRARIRSGTLVKSENVIFEVVVYDLDSTPRIDVTVK